jgi:hypothetical protein
MVTNMLTLERDPPGLLDRRRRVNQLPTAAGAMLWALGDNQQKPPSNSM